MAAPEKTVASNSRREKAYLMKSFNFRKSKLVLAGLLAGSLL
jgi:hypothetical protein